MGSCSHIWEKISENIILSSLIRFVKVHELVNRYGDKSNGGDSSYRSRNTIDKVRSPCDQIKDLLRPIRKICTSLCKTTPACTFYLEQISYRSPYLVGSTFLTGVSSPSPLLSSLFSKSHHMQGEKLMINIFSIFEQVCPSVFHEQS